MDHLIALVRTKEFQVLAGCVLSALIVYLVHRTKARSADHRKLGRLQPRASSLADPSEKAARAEKERMPGEWTPVKFDYPRIEPCKEHFSTLKPIPYRPFKWGEYHVNMGIRGMAWDEWMELDNEFPQFRKVCDYRIRTAGHRLVKMQDAQPGVVESGHEAAKEFMYELAEYLSRRHPDVYSVTRHPVSEREEDNGWYGEGRIKTITVIPFQDTYELEKGEPLKIARMLIQEDFTIMLEGTDGRYYLQAGAVVIAGSWRLEDKMGMPLEQIHTSGNVPQYKTKLQTSLDRFFQRMPLDKPVVRNNYTFQVVQEPSARVPPPAPGSLLDVDPDELAWSVTMNGDEETSEYVRTVHVHDPNDPDAVEAAAADVGHDIRPGVSTATPATPKTLRMRVERQTLRRLPRTGAIVFTIRIYQTRVDEMVREPGVPGRLASALRSWPEDVARYKARGAFEAILPYLDQCHEEQVAKGVVDADKKNSNYPF